MLEAFSVTGARNNFLPLINRVRGGLYRFMVTRHGRPVAVVLSYEDYSRMVETLKVIEDKELVHDIKQGATETELADMIKLNETGDEVE
jgi:prevent-host-death family protein